MKLISWLGIGCYCSMIWLMQLINMVETSQAFMYSDSAHSDCAPGHLAVNYTVLEFSKRQSQSDSGSASQLKYWNRKWEDEFVGIENPNVNDEVWPPKNWFASGYDDSKWSTGYLPLGNSNQLKCYEKIDSMVSGAGVVHSAVRTADTMSGDDQGVQERTPFKDYVITRDSFYLRPSFFLRVSRVFIHMMVDYDLIEAYLNGVASHTHHHYNEMERDYGARESLHASRSECANSIHKVLDADALVPGLNQFSLLVEDPGIDGHAYLNYRIVVETCEPIRESRDDGMSSLSYGHYHEIHTRDHAYSSNHKPKSSSSKPMLDTTHRREISKDSDETTETSETSHIVPTTSCSRTCIPMHLCMKPAAANSNMCQQTICQASESLIMDTEGDCMCEIVSHVLDSSSTHSSHIFGSERNTPALDASSKSCPPIPANRNDFGLHPKVAVRHHDQDFSTSTYLNLLSCSNYVENVCG